MDAFAEKIVEFESQRPMPSRKFRQSFAILQMGLTPDQYLDVLKQVLRENEGASDSRIKCISFRMANFPVESMF